MPILMHDNIVFKRRLGLHYGLVFIERKISFPRIIAVVWSIVFLVQILLNAYFISQGWCYPIFKNEFEYRLI